MTQLTINETPIRVVDSDPFYQVADEIKTAYNFDAIPGIEAQWVYA